MDKIAIFGGTFDPIHLGHTACLKHLSEKMNFSKVYLVPTNVNPLKTGMEPASTQDRLHMIELALADFDENIEIDRSELEASGPSYTWDTLQKYIEKHPDGNLYLCMGIDVFKDFDHWKNFAHILENVNLVILSRPPYNRPFAKEDFPAGVQEFIHSYDRGFCLLTSNRTIEFVKIDSADISSREIRKRLRSGKDVGRYLSLEVEKYITEKGVYPRLAPGEIEFSDLVQFCGKELSLKAMNTAAYDLQNLGKLYDYTMVASATSTKQAQALAENLKLAVKDEFGLLPFGEEGMSEGRWVILDYGALIIHLFYDYVRMEYHLEQLWEKGKRINLAAPTNEN